jgi:hypothetical protein
MSFVIGGNNPVSTGYNLTRSLRTRAGASAYLNRTPATAGNQRTWTYSNWVKRSTLGATQNLFTVGTGSGLYFYLRFLSTDVLEVFTYDATGGTYVWQLQTTQVFRDPSAWYHIIISTDTTQATAANRVKIYINGTQVTAFAIATYPSLNYDTRYNVNVASYINSYIGASAYFDGYQAEFNSVDGQALTPSSFGSTNATTGVWQPARYTGTYGTNGFYLPFTDNSALTTSSNVGLGKDFSGNGNYWVTNNISITAGVTYDSMTDVPTLTSATAANFAVLNPINAFGSATTASGNLFYTITSSSSSVVFSSIACSGKNYFEEKGNAFGSGIVGLACLTNITASAGVLYYSDGRLYINNSLQGTYATWSSSDTMACDVDTSTRQIRVYKNNTQIGSTGTASGTEPLFFSILGSGSGSGSPNGYVNFGQQPWVYTPPTGFVALNTYNLPTSTIVKGNTVMDATLYTGTGASLSVTNAASFKPDLVWPKSRSAATSNKLTDSVRGVTKALISNSDSAETTDVQGITAINSNGFTVGTNTDYNNLAATYVAWQWQAGQGSSSSNTNGTITSTVSVNASAGFSVVTYTGNGTNPGATIGHGLGVAPAMIICKNRSNVDWWPSYHVSAGITNTLYLNDTVGSSTYLNRFSAVSSTTFTTGSSGAELNTNANNYVAYCWTPIAGFSAFGSYTGNGLAAGPFVYTGFQPKWVMWKRTDVAGTNWVIVDTSRQGYNTEGPYLLPNSSGAEGTYANINVLSNGFQQTSTAGGDNASGGTFIYAAFATTPFKNSLGF